MKKTTKLLIALALLLCAFDVNAQSDGQDPEDITNVLGDMQGGYAFGNACGEPNFMTCNVYSDMNMNYNTLVVRYVKIIVHGNIVNQGTIIFECDESELQVLGSTLSTTDTQDFNISISPNPASTYIHINAKGLRQITFIDLTGRVLKRYKTIVDNNTINVSNLASGMYLVQLQDVNNRTEVKRVVIN